jgi:hypothetical protein
MSDLSSQALDDWFWLLPIQQEAEPDLAAALLSDLEDNPAEVASCLQSLYEVVDFTRISFVALLFRMTMLETDRVFVSSRHCRPLADQLWIAAPRPNEGF